MDYQPSDNQKSSAAAGPAGGQGVDADAPPGGQIGHEIGQSMGAGLRLERRLPPPKLYRIGEVVEYSRMSRQTIHNYTVMGLLHESKWTDGGHRLYDESVFERLDVIAALRHRNESLETIRQHLEQLRGPVPREGERALS